MNTRQAILCWTLPLLLTGCVPGAVTYYRPTADGGRIIVDNCTGTEREVEFEIASLTVRALVLGRKGEKQVHVAISSAPSRTRSPVFHFSSSDFEVRDTDNNLSVGVTPTWVLRNDRTGSLTEPYSAESGMLFRIELPNPTPDNFALLSPSIVVDGKEMDFPSVYFRHEVRAGILPFNC